MAAIKIINLPYNLGTRTQTQMRRLVQKYLRYYRDKVTPLYDREYPTYRVAHNPIYNKQDHIVVFNGKEWICYPACTGHKLNGICPHIAAVLFYRGDLTLDY